MDLLSLTNDEAQHVLKVVRRDMKLRKKEENRLSDLKHELEEEGVHCLLLAKQRGFNKQCCIRCCGPFSFILKPRHVCLDCHYNVCKTCCFYSHHDNGYVCVFCHKSRLLRAQSFEWYYKNVKSRFKRFGSAKVLKTLFKKHIIAREALLELPEINVPEGSNDNHGSGCDNEFNKQSKNQSISESNTVALRVAEEAIEEAITKAEGHRDSLRLLPALSVTSDDFPDKGPFAEKVSEAVEPDLKIYSSLRKESRASILGWKNVDRLDNSNEAETGSESDKEPTEHQPYQTGASSVLQSPDGNWIALHTSQHSRPSLLTKRKSLVYSVLEKESGMVSAYDEMVSDLEDEAECNKSGLALLQFRQCLSEKNLIKKL